MSETVKATNGANLPVADGATALTYSGGSPNFLLTMVQVYQGITYTKTFTNNGTVITNISQWVAS